MPWKATSVMEERIKFIVRASQEGVNISKLCREFGISRPTGYQWLRRYRQAGSIRAVRELSRRPYRSPTRTAFEHEQRVIALRRQHDWGAKKIRELLVREGLDLPVITINRILRRKGLVCPDQSHRPAVKRFERERPNELWQMDFKGDYALRRGRCYPLSILDDHSRFAVGVYALSDQCGETVHGCLVRTFETYGVPEAMLMDHGTPWWATSSGHGLTRLSVSLIKQGIRLYWSGVGHPQTQGKVERFHRTLKHAVRHHGRPQTLSEWENALPHFLQEYNHVRPHEALQMAVPAERYYPSPKQYNPQPSECQYPLGAIVKRLNSQGCLDYHHRRYFVCEALCSENVQIEHVENRLLIRYRHMYIREIELETGRTVPLALPVSQT